MIYNKYMHRRAKDDENKVKDVQEDRRSGRTSCKPNYSDHHYTGTVGVTCYSTRIKKSIIKSSKMPK